MIDSEKDLPLTQRQNPGWLSRQHTRASVSESSGERLRHHQTARSFSVDDCLSNVHVCCFALKFLMRIIQLKCPARWRAFGKKKNFLKSASGPLAVARNYGDCRHANGLCWCAQRFKIPSGSTKICIPNRAPSEGGKLTSERQSTGARRRGKSSEDAEEKPKPETKMFVKIALATAFSRFSDEGMKRRKTFSASS
jgi:hypothetical protein